MNILNISQHFRLKGGSDVYFRSLTKLLKSYDHHVEEFASSDTDHDIYPVEIDFDKPSLGNISKYIYNKEAKRKMKRFIDQKEIDLAHLHIYYGKLSASILSPLKDKGIPIIQTLHEYKLVCPTYKLYDGHALCFDCKNNQFYKSLNKKCNRGSLARTALSAIESYISLWNGAQHLIDHFITVSEFQKRQMVAMGIDENRLSTVHNFLDLSKYSQSPIIGDYVLYFGRLEKEKGLEVLLDAFEHLSSEVKLIIIGEGSYKDEMLQRIERINAGKSRISYGGFLYGEALKEIISSSKFVVVPSIWFETFGLTVIEAMAYGKPVIGSDIGGISEIINDGEDGFLVEANNSNALVTAIEKLFVSKEMVCEFGANARRNVEKRFTPAIHYENLMSIYKKFT